MSSHRNPQGNTNRQAGRSKGLAKTQKVFVPKNQGQNRPRSPKSPNPTLSASLRQSLSQPSNAEVSSAAASASPESSSRVRMGERGEWVSTKGNLVNYLPQDEVIAASLGADEGGLDAVESQRVIDLLNRELSRLLKLTPKEFWKQGSHYCQWLVILPCVNFWRASYTFVTAANTDSKQSPDALSS